MGRKTKFPDTADLKLKEKTIICPADRVLALYNEANPKGAKKISATVRTWFKKQAQVNGWAGIHWVKEVQSKNGAGCILARPPEKVGISVKITKTTVLLDSDEA